MSDDWQPTGPWMHRFRKALLDAYDVAAMQLLTTDYFAPNTFDNISPAGPGMNHEFRLQQYINEARMDSWLPDLVAAARERRPTNKAIADIATDLGLTAAGPRVDNPTGQSLEALIQSAAKFINPETFYGRLPQLEAQVCWIRIPGGGGTGFLVGPDLVLTNQHVIAPLLTGAAQSADVRCLFDHRQPVDGPALKKKKATEVKLADDWQVFNQPPSSFDWNPTLGDAAPDEVDTAVIRLEEPVGELRVGPDPYGTEGPVRSWIDLVADPPAVAAGNQVFLLQHPRGEPLQLAVGTVTQFNGSGTRVRYDANSKDGSSGSPCFDADLRPVALHHAHDPAYPPSWNQAIPLTNVRKALHNDGIQLTAPGD